MTSHRHNTDPRDSYLDAARECLLDLGWRRTTLTEVARRAGVSRMTIYRAWPDMTALLGDLMTREWGGLLTAVDTTLDPDGGLTPTALADAVIAQIRGLRANPLFVRILEVDPELVLPYVFERRGRTQELIGGLLAGLVEQGQAAGTIAPGPPVALARTVLLLCHGFALSAHTMVDHEVGGDVLDAGLRAALVGLLTPPTTGAAR